MELGTVIFKKIRRDSEQNTIKRRKIDEALWNSMRLFWNDDGQTLNTWLKFFAQTISWRMFT